MTREIRSAVTATIIVVGLLAIVEAVVRWWRIPPYLFPAPSVVGRELLRSRAYFAQHAKATAFEALCGLALAVIIGFVSGVALAEWRRIRESFLPLLVASQAVPIIAVAPIVVLWFGNGYGSKIAMAALLCYFPLTVNSMRGMSAPSSMEIDVFRMYAATRWQMFAKLRLPASVPFVFGGLRVSAALATIGAIVAEYAGADRGLGYVITQSTYRLDTPQLFAAVLCSAFIGCMFYGVIVIFERVFLRRFNLQEWTVTP